MNQYYEFDSLRTLFNTNDSIYQLYDTLKTSMVKYNDEKFTILVLCPTKKEMNDALAYSVKRCTELEYLSNHESRITSMKNNKIYFYNLFKDRNEEILIFPLEKIKQGFDGYRISQIIFYDQEHKRRK